MSARVSLILVVVVERTAGGRGGFHFQHGFGQIFQLNQFIHSQHDGALDCVLQLAHVAGPIVCAQRDSCGWREAARLPLAFRGVSGDEVGGQQRNVGLTFAKRRQP